MPDTIPDWARSLWPAGNRELLLQALFHRDGDAARTAWSTWEAAVDFDDVDWAYIRVLPAMSRRWDALELKSDNAARIAGMHRFAWARTQICLQRVAPLLAALAKAQVPVLVIKGCARTLSALPNRNERVVNDVDIVFRRSDLARALQVAESEGWSCPWDIAPDRARHLLRVSRHSLPYRHQSQDFDVLDIHSSVLFANRCLDHDDALWSRSVPVRFRGNPARIPHPADQLVIACTHGLFFEHEPKPMDWVADCIDVLGAPGVADDPEFWPTVLSETARRDIAPNVYAGLSFLSSRLGQPIPDRVLDTLLSESRQPFIDECLGSARSGDALTPETRAAWGAAFVERSASSAARRNQAGDADRPAVPPPEQPDWQQPGAGDGHRLSLPTPPGDLIRAARQAGRHLSLQLCGTAPRAARRGHLDLGLIAMDMHVVEIARSRLKKSIFSGRWKADFPILPSLFEAYDLDGLWIELTRPGSIEPLGPDDYDRRIRFRWLLGGS